MPGIQYWFTGTALGVFLGLLTSLVTLGYSWYRSAVTEMDAAANKSASIIQRAQTARVKDLLGKQISAANAMLSGQPREDSAQAWGQKTHDLIKAAYGEGEAALFLDNSGYVFFSSDGQVRNWMNGRMRRLSELLQRADTLTVKDNFDATKFE